MKKISFSLDTKEIGQAIKSIEKYRDSIKQKSERLVKALIDDGVIILRAKIVEMNINDTGNLLNFVGGYYNADTNTGIIRVDCDYAVFVEFGTGIVGMNSPYSGNAMAEIGYKYGGGTHYIVTKDGRIGWFYPTDDGKYRFTEGMPSRPFMYETAKELTKRLNKKIKEVFV